MRRLGNALALGALIGLSACMSSAQKTHIAKLESDAAELGHPEIKYQDTVDPDTALGLGFVPFGAGGFYVSRPGLGISGFLWPLSITWLPFQAYNTALEGNISRLENQVASLKDDQLGLGSTGNLPGALQKIDTMRDRGQISDAEHQQLRQKVLEKAVP